jgi:hypothetical protein
VAYAAAWHASNRTKAMKMTIDGIFECLFTILGTDAGGDFVWASPLHSPLSALASLNHNLEMALA